MALFIYPRFLPAQSGLKYIFLLCRNTLQEGVNNVNVALLTYITRLWPILLLIILGIFVAALRLLFLSSQKVEPVRPLLTLPPPHQPPTEKDLQSAAYTIVQCRITQILSAKFPEARWVWENPRAMEDILAGNPTYRC